MNPVQRKALNSSGFRNSSSRWRNATRKWRRSRRKVFGVWNKCALKPYCVYFQKDNELKATIQQLVPTKQRKIPGKTQMWRMRNPESATAARVKENGKLRITRSKKPTLDLAARVQENEKLENEVKKYIFPIIVLWTRLTYFCTASGPPFQVCRTFHCFKVFTRHEAVCSQRQR